jgi:hypothetical protein
MAREIHLGNGESAFLEVDDQAGRLQPPENFFHILLMLLYGGAGYDDIVKIDESEGQPGQHPIHGPWKVLPALRSPKVRRRNSKSPNSMMMVVFKMSAGCKGI